MQTLRELLGQRIREIREAKNVKQVDLANWIDIEPTNLSKIEKGIHLPKDETIKKITQALNIDIRELFDFAHIHSKKELLQKIENFLLNAKIEDLEFLYRVIISYIESQKNK